MRHDCLDTSAYFTFFHPMQLLYTRVWHGSLENWLVQLLMLAGIWLEPINEKPPEVVRKRVFARGQGMCLPSHDLRKLCLQRLHFLHRCSSHQTSRLNNLWYLSWESYHVNPSSVKQGRICSHHQQN